MLAYGELSRELRNGIWDILYPYFHSEFDRQCDPVSFYEDGHTAATLFLRYHLDYPIDDARKNSRNAQKFVAHLKEIVLNGEYFSCLGAIQYFMRLEGRLGIVFEKLKSALDDPTSPYVVVNFPPLTIIPRGDENEKEAFEKNWAIIKASTFEGAKTHLRKSAEALNKGDAPGAIRGAIHAVEGAAQIITGKEKATLGDALKVLERDKGLNSVLSTAFGKLYGYTSSEKGIRHALMEGDNANVGQDEALFMFSACTAFVAYLARKYPEKV